MVSFELSEDQRLLQETVAAFAVEQIRPLARDADERGAAPESVVAKAWELGLVASAIPESYGGFGDVPSALTGAIGGVGLLLFGLTTDERQRIWTQLRPVTLTARTNEVSHPS